jgi:hypothetical protein
MRPRTTHISTTIGFGILSACACVIGPREEQMVLTTQPLSFSGLASQPSSMITVEALDLSTNQWEPIGTTTTLADVWSIGARPFYYFNTSITIQSLPEWQCYYESSCDLSEEGCRDIRFRVRESNGLVDVLFTYTDESFECTSDLVLEEFENAYDAYAICNPGLPQEIVARSCFLH